MVDAYKELDALIASAPRMVSTDARLFLLDRYEQVFNIRNHEDPTDQHPYGPIRMNDCEDWVEGGAVYERMKEFKHKRIHEHFGVSFQEFIDQPTYRCNQMLKLAAQTQKKEAAIVKELDEIERSQNR